MQVTNITEFPNRKITLLNFTDHEDTTVALRQTNAMQPEYEARVVLYEDEIKLLISELQGVLDNAKKGGK